MVFRICLADKMISQATAVLVQYRQSGDKIRFNATAYMYTQTHLFLLSAILYGVVNSWEAEPRIVGGTIVKNMTHFPYQVSLRYLNGHICGGSIINPNHVLTAAHCVYNAKRKMVISAQHFSVQVGSLRVNNPSAHQEKVVNVFQHEKYNSETQDNDICVLRLARNLTFSNTVRAINLTNIPRDSGHCNVSGWGNTATNGPPSLNLLYVDVPIVPWVNCSLVYKSLFNKSLCAGDAEKDSCQGDSGGPLVCNNTLTGIVSYGTNQCGSPKFPGVYTDVYQYKDWIAQQLIRSSSKESRLSQILLTVVILIIYQLK